MTERKSLTAPPRKPDSEIPVVKLTAPEKAEPKGPVLTGADLTDAARRALTIQPDGSLGYGEPAWMKEHEERRAALLKKYAESQKKAQTEGGE